MIRKLSLRETETESKKVILEPEPNSHKQKKDEQTNAGIIEDKLTKGRTEKAFRGNSLYARPSVRSFCWSVRSFVRSFVRLVGRSVGRSFVRLFCPSIPPFVRPFLRPFVFLTFIFLSMRLFARSFSCKNSPHVLFSPGFANNLIFLHLISFVLFSSEMCAAYGNYTFPCADTVTDFIVESDGTITIAYQPTYDSRPPPAERYVARL